MVRVARVSAIYQSLRFMFGEWTTMTLANSNPLTSNVLPTLRWAMRRSAWRIRFSTYQIASPNLGVSPALVILKADRIADSISRRKM